MIIMLYELIFLNWILLLLFIMDSPQQQVCPFLVRILTSWLFDLPELSHLSIEHDSFEKVTSLTLSSKTIVGSQWLDLPHLRTFSTKENSFYRTTSFTLLSVIGYDWFIWSSSTDIPRYRRLLFLYGNISEFIKYDCCFILILYLPNLVTLSTGDYSFLYGAKLSVPCTHSSL